MTATDTVKAALAKMTPPYSGQCETVRETLTRMAQNDEATRTIVNGLPELLAEHEAALKAAKLAGVAEAVAAADRAIDGMAKKHETDLEQAASVLTKAHSQLLEYQWAVRMLTESVVPKPLHVATLKKHGDATLGAIAAWRERRAAERTGER